MKFAAALLIAIIATSPMYATCGPSQCPTSLCLAELVYDEYFNDNCAWVFTNNSSREYVNGGWVGQLDGLGRVYQDIVVPSGYQSKTMTFTFWLNIANASAGTERLNVIIYDGNGIAHTVDTVYPNAGSGRHDYVIDNFSLPSQNQTIELSFEYVRGTNPLGTVFNVESAHMWIMNY
jgi:hypothetical protein